MYRDRRPAWQHARRRQLPLHAVSSHLHAKALLDANAVPDIDIDALDNAAADGRIQIVKLLLEAGVDTTRETHFRTQAYEQWKFSTGSGPIGSDAERRACRTLIRQSASLRSLLRVVLVQERATEIALGYLVYDNAVEWGVWCRYWACQCKPP